MRPFLKQYRNEQIACLLCGVRDVRGACAGRGVRDAGRSGCAAAANVQVKRVGQARGNLNIALMCEVMFLVYPEHVHKFLVIWF